MNGWYIAMVPPTKKCLYVIFLQAGNMNNNMSEVR